jgi:hypothetical protein
MARRSEGCARARIHSARQDAEQSDEDKSNGWVLTNHGTQNNSIRSPAPTRTTARFVGGVCTYP